MGGRSDYTGPAMRILPRTGARLYLSERWKVENSINNNDRQQQLSCGVETIIEQCFFFGPVSVGYVREIPLERY